MIKTGYIVYKHTTPNRKIYIGITSLSLQNRWRNGKGYRRNTLFFKAINKYGWDNIKHEVLFDNLTKEEAEQKEIELIKLYKSNNKKFGYNIENGGNSKGKISDAEKKKRSIIFKGKNNPMYGVKRYGAENPAFGKHWTEERKKQHSQKLMGRYKGNNNPMFGKHHTEKQKALFSEMFKGSKNPRAKKVFCIETNTIYLTAKEASKITGINNSSISQCCNGKYKTAGGYHWKFLNEGDKN